MINRLLDNVYMAKWLHKLCVWTGTCLLGVVFVHAQSQELLDANPGRPTVSTPATLTPVGYLQFETGVLQAWESPDFSRRFSLVEVMKLTVHKRLQFIVSDEPLVYSHDGVNIGKSTGDVLLGVQALILPGKGWRPTLSASYFRHIYAGTSPDLDLGTPHNSVLLLLSGDIKGFHYDTNYFFNEVVDTADHRPQFGQTLSVSHPLHRKLGVSVELWHFTQPFLRSRTLGTLWALNYNARKNLVYDFGFANGYSTNSTHWQAFAGFTYLLPHRLWH